MALFSLVLLFHMTCWLAVMYSKSTEKFSYLSICYFIVSDSAFNHKQANAERHFISFAVNKIKFLYSFMFGPLSMHWYIIMLWFNFILGLNFIFLCLWVW